MNIFCKILTLGALVLGADSAFAQTDTIVTKHGNRLVKHTRLSGASPQPGDFTFFNAHTFVADSLVGSTVQMGGPREWQLPVQPPQRVPSLYDAFLLMAKGDSATVLQPVDSTLRRNMPPQWRDVQFVRYEVVLVDFYTEAEKNRRDSVRQAEAQAKLATVEKQTQDLAKAFKAGNLNQQLKKTESGLQYIIHDPGSGAPLVKGENVRAHYYGCLTDGTHFDNSFGRGEPLPFALGVGQMIPGFDEGVALLRHGGKATLFLPYQLAYGEQGTGDGVIPAKADLVFYVEIQ